MKILLGILPLFLLFFVASVSAIYGGETASYEIEKCSFLVVNITPCESDEWIVEGCVETSDCGFECECHDNYILNLTPAVNSVGSFIILMNYNYYVEEQPQPQITFFSSPVTYGCEALGWRCLSNATCCSDLLCIDGKCVNTTVVEPDEPEPPINGGGSGEPEPPINGEEDVPEPPIYPEPTDTNWVWLIVLMASGFVIIILLIMVAKAWKNKKEEKPYNTGEV